MLPQVSRTKCCVRLCASLYPGAAVRRNKERSTCEESMYVYAKAGLSVAVVKGICRFVYCRRPRMLKRLVLGFSIAPSKVFARLASLWGVLYFAKERSNFADVTDS